MTLPTGEAYWLYLKSLPPDPTRQARGMLRRPPKIPRVKKPSAVAQTDQSNRG